jgi:hypothetical protein
MRPTLRMGLTAAAFMAVSVLAVIGCALKPALQTPYNVVTNSRLAGVIRVGDVGGGGGPQQRPCAARTWLQDDSRRSGRPHSIGGTRRAKDALSDAKITAARWGIRRRRQ